MLVVPKEDQNFSLLSSVAIHFELNQGHDKVSALCVGHSNLCDASLCSSKKLLLEAEVDFPNSTEAAFVCLVFL